MGAKYPKVLTEAETVEAAIRGANLARYGDGEFKLAFNRKCVSQPADKDLAAELRQILKNPPAGCLPCLPSPFGGTPRKESWLNFATDSYVALLDPNRVYGSAFVTRPDSAPWIDTPEYWSRVKDLWRGKNVTLVIGTQRSLREDMIKSECRSLHLIEGPSGQKGDGAYAKIDEIEQRIIAAKSDIAIMCLGAAATVLAARLAARSIRAVDLGHIGMFMRSAGAYRYQLDDLISPGYREVLLKMHGRGKWGGDGAKHVEAANALADQLQAETILDYGCGEMFFAEAMKPRRVSGFDPGMPGRQGMPKPCDLLVCTDVLEHVEPEKLGNVFGHMRSVMLKGAYVVIATRPAKAILPDGRNAHLCVHEAPWWIKGLSLAGFIIERTEVQEGKEVRLWLRK